MRIVSNDELDVLIQGLKEYEAKGVRDPWLFSDGTTVEPLAVLEELKLLRTITGGRWMIWSNEHNAWWKANRNGYCYLPEDMPGTYSFEEALDIVSEANKFCGKEPNEAMVRV